MLLAERQHRVGEQHGNEHHDRREKVDDFVRRARHDVFLREHFHAVGNELAEAGEADFRERNADAVGAVAVLDAADAFALKNHFSMPSNSTSKINTLLGGIAGLGLCRAVSQLGRDEQLPLVADLHQLQGLDPSRDHARDRKGDGLTALHRTVKDRSVNQRAVVMHLDRVGRLGRLASAGLDDLVLQTAGRSLDAFFFGVRREKGFTGVGVRGVGICFRIVLVFFDATTGEQAEGERQDKK